MRSLRRNARRRWRRTSEEADKASEIDRLSSVREKTGVFTGAYAINPINGRQGADLDRPTMCLYTYGTGCVMAVPAHDERDFVFADQIRPAHHER